MGKQGIIINKIAHIKIFTSEYELGKNESSIFSMVFEIILFMLFGFKFLSHNPDKFKKIHYPFFLNIFVKTKYSKELSNLAECFLLVFHLSHELFHIS